MHVSYYFYLNKNTLSIVDFFKLYVHNYQNISIQIIYKNIYYTWMKQPRFRLIKVED